jgi:transcriptional regulator with GAF, ATPase, and Fis domain
MQRFAKKFNKPVNRVSEGTMSRMARYSWPGNIRELQNVVERAVVLSQGSTLALSVDFDSVPVESGTSRSILQEKQKIEEPPVPAAGENAVALEDVERRHIESVLKQTNWMIEGNKGAAKILNLNPSTLRSRMQKLGIRRPGPSASL